MFLLLIKVGSLK